ncbi:MAG TPA: hypothetical protein VFI84_02540 [Candidatus Saccharimonadales bacterium]|nr:hypothetical protein [Candidatus Saccharimonadales bacterium]
MIEGLGRTCADDISDHTVAMERFGRYHNSDFISVIGGKVTFYAQQHEATRAFLLPKDTPEAIVVSLPTQPETPVIFHEVA